MVLSPKYVQFAEGDWKAFDSVNAAFSKLRRGQKVITCVDGQFILAKVSSVNNDDIRAVDGPVVRVSNGESSWRVDGNGYAFPVES
jgi:hypothetical protein